MIRWTIAFGLLLSTGSLSAPQDACLRGDGRACLALARSSKDDFRVDELLQRACDTGIADGCHDLALRVAGRRADPATLTRVTVLLQEACDKGASVACGHLAARLHFGAGAPLNPLLARALAARAVPALDASCRKGNGIDCDIRAFLSFASAAGARADASKYWSLALPLLQTGCAKGDGAQCRVQAAILSRPLGKTDATAAVKAMRRGCELNDVWACDGLAHALFDGVGVEADGSQALQVAEKACSAGHPSSCRLVGESLRSGVAGTKDEARATTLLREVDASLERQCEWLDGASCWLLRFLRDTHRTGSLEAAARPAFNERTVASLGTQCDLVGGWYCQMLAWELRSGTAGPVNLEAAVALEKKACADGLWWSCRELAGAYRSGERVAASEGRARWYDERACELGFSKSCEVARASEARAVPPPSQSTHECFGGQRADADGVGQCCWPGQVYSSKAARCVGAPACPSHLSAAGETCQCAGGQVISSATRGHCCWEGQTWSSETGACEGVPSSCPQTHFASGGACQPLPVCPDGLEASQTTAGACCWPGQSFASGKCSGKPTRCRAGWVAAPDACVPGIAEVWPYLTAAVSRAREVDVPVYSEFNDGRAQLGGWAYTNAEVRLEGRGCSVTLVENRQSLQPDLQNAITPTEARLSFELGRVGFVSVTDRSNTPSSGGSWTFRTIDGRTTVERYMVMLHLGDGLVRKKEVTQDWVYDEATDREVQKPFVREEVTSTVIFETSFRGAAIEAARAFIAAGRACGGAAAPADFKLEGSIELNAPFDLEAEQRELSNRLRLQEQAWSQGREELRRAQAAARASSAAMVTTIITGLQQSQAQITAWNQNLYNATQGLAVVPTPVTPPPSTPRGPAPVVQPGANTGGAGATGSPAGFAASSATGAAAPGSFQVLPTGCQACPRDCEAELAACKKGNSPGACYQSATCVCRCMKNLGGCGTSQHVLDRCISSNTTQTTQLASGTGTAVDVSPPARCERTTYPMPTPKGEKCEDCREYWRWKHAQCIADAEFGARTPQNFCREQAPSGAHQRCNDLYLGAGSTCCPPGRGAGVAR